MHHSIQEEKEEKEGTAETGLERARWTRRPFEERVRAVGWLAHGGAEAPEQLVALQVATAFCPPGRAPKRWNREDLRLFFRSYTHPRLRLACSGLTFRAVRDVWSLSRFKEEV